MDKQRIVTDSVFNAIRTTLDRERSNITSYVEARVVSVSTYTAKVNMNGGNITVYKRENDNISNGDIVLVCKPNGVMSDAFIDIVKK